MKIEKDSVQQGKIRYTFHATNEWRSWFTAEWFLIMVSAEIKKGNKDTLSAIETVLKKIK